MFLGMLQARRLLVVHDVRPLLVERVLTVCGARRLMEESMLLGMNTECAVLPDVDVGWRHVMVEVRVGSLLLREI